jgi:hypothetical protein
VFVSNGGKIDPQIDFSNIDEIKRRRKLKEFAKCIVKLNSSIRM